MVFAFGSPEGLRNTVTMGVVSAVARQPDPDSPLVYVQTDTPINPGNSGGALVDADGRLVGINTFILSSSGGNQGLGFAIPADRCGFRISAIIEVWPHPSARHRRAGANHHAGIGCSAPPDARFWCHRIRCSSRRPADAAGLKIQDIVLSVDGNAVAALPLFAQSLYMHKSGEHAKLEILRGSNRLQVEVPLVERPTKEDSLTELADPVKNLVRPLNILGIEITLDIAHSLPELRLPTGVIVAARTLGVRTAEVPLQTGDVIHGINGAPVTTLEGLREALAKPEAR